LNFFTLPTFNGTRSRRFQQLASLNPRSLDQFFGLASFSQVSAFLRAIIIVFDIALFAHSMVEEFFLSASNPSFYFCLK